MGRARQHLEERRRRLRIITFAFSAGTGGKVVIKNAGTNGFVIADAVNFEKQ